MKSKSETTKKIKYKNMSFSDEGVLFLMRRSVETCFKKPARNYKNHSIDDILGRLSYGSSDNKLLSMYCDVIGLDEKKVKKSIIKHNIKYLYDTNYKRKKLIKLVERGKDMRWLFE